MLTGEKVDVEKDEHTLDTSDTEKYLGDLISNDDKNTTNIKARQDKDQGIVDQI